MIQYYRLKRGGSVGYFQKDNFQNSSESLVSDELLYTLEGAGAY